MKVTATTSDAYRLLHEGSITLARVEANGIRIDQKHLRFQMKRLKKKITREENKLRGTKVFAVWRKRYGSNANLDSKAQLGEILFGDLKMPGGKRTAKGNQWSTDASLLEGLDNKFVKRLLQLGKAKKARNTFLRGIERETTAEGFLHANFNLHIARSYRSSSDTPNFQNFPVRDPIWSEVIRKCFIPRKGRVIVEIDYSGVEVCVAACYNKDPRLIEYIKDPTKDMHRDMAAECFCCDPSEVTKMMRYVAKNRFVFPNFYGSYWPQTAPNLWEGIERLGLKEARKFLKKAGIKKLGSLDTEDTPKKGTFARHILETEKDFWRNRFKVYDRWKKEWWETYQETGYFDLFTGFRIEGVMKKNDVINYPVQGAAFHCLLWALNRLQKLIDKAGMKTLIIGQIHDSIVADVPVDELEDFLRMAKRVMTVDLPKAWRWINIPLSIEAEVCPVGGSWFDKKEMGIV